jgi:Carboxypeptidase regulatory-like domain
MNWTRWASVAIAFLLLVVGASAQETTGGLQGTVKDPSGAVVAGAHIVLTGGALIGNKEINADSSGYYRFANLPPGTYDVTVTATGFSTLKQGNIVIGVGQVSTTDFAMQLGAVTSTVEVTGAAPLIDVATNQNMTDLDTTTLDNVPHGLSFQSVIQFAPMARNEPLEGYTNLMGNGHGMGQGGTGGSMPGSSGNGLAFGYSIGGGADSENQYLINGQDTEELSGGYSNANLPFPFIDSVNLKTSGIEAEYGGALGGVVNVVTKSGGNNFHGSFFITYGGSGIDANNNNIFPQYDPNGGGAVAGEFDPNLQLYEPKKDHFTTAQPGFTIGGPIVKDRLWFFAGFAPEYQSTAKTVDFDSTVDNNANFVGNQYFTQDRQTYFTNGRLDAAASQKVRLYAAWIDQYTRETGDSMPASDPTNPAFLNPSINTPVADFSHGLGYAAPNSIYNFGADITITPQIVATTRFGYFFYNYHDFGWQTQTPNLNWAVGGLTNDDNTGKLLPSGLLVPTGGNSAPYVSTFTPFNTDKHHQFNQDISFIKGGWGGTHYFKVGYQLNRLSNIISQNGNVAQAFIYAGSGNSYSPSTTTGTNNCALLAAEWGSCAGQYGYLQVQDFATILPVPAVDWNHALYAQDSWNVGHGLTLNIGVRVEKEDLPAPDGVKVPAIHFSWTDKVAPRLGAAWDPTGRGKMKLFASYGVVNDVMKLLLAQTSWGAQVFENCTYPLGPDGTAAGFSVSDIDITFKNGRACPSGPVTLGANFTGSSTPASLVDAKTGVSLIENVNLRPAEPVAPGVKPYRQHEVVTGGDYAFTPSLALEVRYDRRRLDHIIEDASLADPTVGELYSVVNPGQGVDRTLDGYASFLQSLGQGFLVPGYSFNSGDNFGTCPSCPPNPKAIRDYDGVEFRLTKSGRNFSGMFSYTWSRLWGNYAGLTTSDQTDGAAVGRNSPDTSRSFDEPFYYFKANGQSNAGPLPTDRPNTFKLYGYYTVPWKHQKTTFGMFQYLYQGTPMSSYLDLATAAFQEPYESSYIFGRGMWSNISTNSTGNITFGTPYARRTPWFTQSDFNIAHEFEVGEHRSLRFEASASNLWNQHNVVQYWGGMSSIHYETPLAPGVVTVNCPPPTGSQTPAAACPVSLSSGAALYQTLETGYNPQQWVNGATVMDNGATVNVPGVIKSSWYGRPVQYQLHRSLLLTATYSF